MVFTKDRLGFCFEGTLCPEVNKTIDLSTRLASLLGWWQNSKHAVQLLWFSSAKESPLALRKCAVLLGQSWGRRLHPTVCVSIRCWKLKRFKEARWVYSVCKHWNMESLSSMQSRIHSKFQNGTTHSLSKWSVCNPEPSFLLCLQSSLFPSSFRECQIPSILAQCGNPKYVLDLKTCNVGSPIAKNSGFSHVFCTMN